MQGESEQDAFKPVHYTVTVYVRDKDSANCEYKISTGPDQNTFRDREDYEAAMGMGVDWWFPGGDSTLDKIVIDDVTYAVFPKASDTVFRRGSVVKAYKTFLPSDSDDADQE